MVIPCQVSNFVQTPILILKCSIKTLLACFQYLYKHFVIKLQINPAADQEKSSIVYCSIKIITTNFCHKYMNDVSF